ncbi:tetratricopeptide repeat protein [Algoriphagus formosus]|uniref:Uncharacterized protein n=1 Tax=Algoriphagus formosus TaxID=2007308 RepID=A0A4R5UWL8_9BACT|nr:hypothetical protein [Algoriphagus aquimaris]TDK43466.1 hypothetical protein E1898_12725 [Algoriphagus aquimaris]
MRKRVTIVILIFLGFLGGLQAQKKQSLTVVDSETYSLYLAKDWDGVIRVGTEALNQGIDFYYLRVRLGIAFFELENYQEAALHFEKAREVSHEETYVEEYLYYAYLWFGRKAQARLVAQGFSNELKKRTHTEKLTGLQGLDLAYNYTGFLDEKVIEDFVGPIDQGISGYQFVPRFHHYGFLGLDFQVTPSWSIYQGISFLKATQFYHYQEEGLSFQLPDNKSSSWQYVASASYYFGKGFHLSFGGQLLFISYDSPSVQSIGNGPQTEIQIERLQEFDWVAFGGISKNLHFLDIGSTLYLGEINGGKQLQSDLQVTLFPMGNLNFYTYSVLSFQNQKLGENPSTNRLIFNQEIGVKLTGFLWLEGYGTFGELENYMTKQGAVVFNRLDQIDQRWGGRLILLTRSNWKLTLDFTHFSNSSRFRSFSFSEEQNQQSYQQKSLTAILSWKF